MPETAVIPLIRLWAGRGDLCLICKHEGHVAHGIAFQSLCDRVPRIAGERVCVHCLAINDHDGQQCPNRIKRHCQAHMVCSNCEWQKLKVGSMETHSFEHGGCRNRIGTAMAQLFWFCWRTGQMRHELITACPPLATCHSDSDIARYLATIHPQTYLLGLLSVSAVILRMRQ
jgi:hypothetical protein